MEILVIVESILIAIFIARPDWADWARNLLSKVPVAGGMFKARGAGGVLPPRK